MAELTAKNYYEQDEYMSVSAFKKLRACEVDGISEKNETSIPMLVGSYVDSFVEGTLDEFLAEHPEIVSGRGATKGELKADFKQAEVICDYITKNKRIQQFLSGEKQTIMTGKINGIPFKIKMDSYSPHKAICDLKVMRTVTDFRGNFYDFVTPWGYDIQLACYQEIVFQNTGERLPCFIVAVTKENPTNSVIIQIPQSILDRALYAVEGEIQHLYEVKMKKVEPRGCGVCESCVTIRTETPIISLADLIGGIGE